MYTQKQKLLKAHQYLYYVLNRPVLSDYEYDIWCKKNNLEGGGGSDSASDYSKEEIQLAERLIKSGK